MWWAALLSNAFVTVCLCIHLLMSCAKLKKCCCCGVETAGGQKGPLKEGAGEGVEGSGKEGSEESSRNGSNARDSFRSRNADTPVNATMQEFWDQLLGTPEKTAKDKGRRESDGHRRKRKDECDHSQDLYWQPDIKILGIKDDDTLCYVDPIPEVV